MPLCSATAAHPFPAVRGSIHNVQRIQTSKGLCAAYDLSSHACNTMVQMLLSLSLNSGQWWPCSTSASALQLASLLPHSCPPIFCIKQYICGQHYCGGLCLAADLSRYCRLPLCSRPLILCIHLDNGCYVQRAGCRKVHAAAGHSSPASGEQYMLLGTVCMRVYADCLAYVPRSMPVRALQLATT